MRVDMGRSPVSHMMTSFFSFGKVHIPRRVYQSHITSYAGAGVLSTSWPWSPATVRWARRRTPDIGGIIVRLEREQPGRSIGSDPDR
jgi:hypothetical protein